MYDLRLSVIPKLHSFAQFLVLPNWSLHGLQMWHDKTNKMSVCPAKTQISLGIRPVWSESSLSAWSKLGSLATHWVLSGDSDQIGQMPRLIRVFAGCTLILLGFVMSWLIFASILVVDKLYTA